MSTPGSILDAQLKSLLELVEHNRDEHCATVQEQARHQGHQIVKAAFAEARRRMHLAVEEERLRMRTELNATRAQWETRKRQRRQREAVALLSLAWQPLRTALKQRWRDRLARAQWVAGLMRQALTALPQARWQVEHPAEWDPRELEAFQGHLMAHCGAEPIWVSSDRIDAGLRISAEGAYLDGTGEGLLSDRRSVEAALLVEFSRLLELQQHDRPS